MSQKWDLEKRPVYDEADPAAPSAFQRDIYSSFRNPSISTKPAEWERLAKSKVPKKNFGYVYGAAGQGRTHKSNTDAFDRYRLKPRMLVNTTRRDLSVNLFGTTLSTPILVGPVGVQSIMHRDAEEATARACLATDTPMVLSTAGTRTIEQVAEANGAGNRWFQLYWPKPQYDDVTASLLRRARAVGFKVLVVTLDTMNLAWRPTDLDEAYLPFLAGEGCQIGFSDPVFQAIYEEQQSLDKRSVAEKLAELYDAVKRPGSVIGGVKMLAKAKTLQKSRLWLDVVHSATYREWAHLEILRKHWDGPIVLKGIQTVEDAHKAIDYGMDGIIVSNHGGRQLDGAIASLDALAAIGADERVKGSSLEVLFDSGIRTGSDVLKAIALGAKAVLIGRPYMYGLAIGGQAGVEHVLKCLKAETDNALGNMGKKSLADLSRDDLEVYEKAKL